MIDKTTIIRNYFLGQLEVGALSSGGKLHGARRIAKELGISFVKVQGAIDSLVRDGILSTSPRSGSYVRDGWQSCILQTNLMTFLPITKLPWIESFKKLLAEHLPNLRFTYDFKQSSFEFRPTLHVQYNQRDYINLALIFDTLDYGRH